MKIGFALPQFHRQAYGVARTAEFARVIENVGGDSLWVGDRNLTAVHPRVGYGGFLSDIPAELRPAADPFTLLAVAASATKKVVLGSHVLAAPLYQPVQLARSLTTIDLISGGRLLPGFGVGWSPEEFEAAGLDFTTRGARMDELLDALEIIWTSDPVEYQGKHVHLPLHHSPLNPAQRPRPPIYLGSFSERALKRVALRADGWLPACTVPSAADAAQLLAQRSLLDRWAEEAGRDPAAIDTVLRVNIDAGTGTEVVAGAIKDLHERTGFDHVMTDTMYSEDSIVGALDFAVELIGLLHKG
jgi:probable F420-dependent oxidoreductase